MKPSALKSAVALLATVSVVAVSTFTFTGSGGQHADVASTGSQEVATAFDEQDPAGPMADASDSASDSASNTDRIDIDVLSAQAVSSQPKEANETSTLTATAAATSSASATSSTSATSSSELAPSESELFDPAGPITLLQAGSTFFTGDAEADFDPALNPDVVIVNDVVDDVGTPTSLGDIVTGNDIKDFRFFYDESIDELFVAINYVGIGGDPDGDGDVASGPIADPANPTNDFGNDPANWQGESFAVTFDVDGDGSSDFIAGVSDLALIGGFSVNESVPFFTDLLPGTSVAYGAPVAGAVGIPPSDTSAARPDIEFSIANFSSLVDPTLTQIGVSAFTGSSAIEAIGSDSVPNGDPFVTIDNPTFNPPTPLVPSISVIKSVEGNDANDVISADTFEVGTTISFDFLVTNNGELDLIDVALDDDVLGVIPCPEATLAVGESMNCSATTVVEEGTTTNTATVSGQPIDADGNTVGDPVSDDDPANHIGATTTISIEKSTNGEDADEPNGPTVEAGGDVTFTYVVTNNGPLTVIDLIVTDDVEGEVCTIPRLDAMTSATCELDISAGIGEYANTGSVVGQPVDNSDTPVGDPLTDDDPSHHIGVCATPFEGPALYRGGETIWNTTLEAADNSTIVLQTSENGASPGQPNEQVYVEIAGVLYGPSKLGLGTITIDVAEGGQIRVLHISEVETDVTGANSVVPTLCGQDITEIVPVCANLITGPNLYRGSQTIWQPGLIAEANSTIRIVTSEHGASPDQPHEQVYLEVGGITYGPTFAGLGDTQFDITTGGEVTILHYSEINTDALSPSALSPSALSPNSVIPSICGDAVSAIPGPVCPTTVTGPRMLQGGTTRWESGLTAEADSTITIVTSDEASDLVQPNEQVFLKVGDVLYGPTPAGRGTATFDITNSGELTVLHYSVVEGQQRSANSVEFTLCGTALFETVDDHS